MVLLISSRFRDLDPRTYPKTLRAFLSGCNEPPLLVPESGVILGHMKSKNLTIVLIVPLVILTSCSHLLNYPGGQEKAKLYLQSAIDFFNQREFGRSLEATQQAIENDPAYAAAYNQLALIYMETKRYQKSEEAFRKALEVQQDYAEVLNNLGALLNRQEKFAQAVPFFERALASERYSTPENALTNMGFSYFKLGQLPRAKAYHQKALDISPAFCLASKNMGDIYIKERNFPRAMDYFQKAVTHCPLYAEGQYKLALTMMKQGQRRVARSQFEKLIEKHRTGPYVERSQEVLKFLR